MKKLLNVLILGVMIMVCCAPASAEYGDYELSDVTFGEPYNYGTAIYTTQLTKGTTTYQDGKPVGITACQGTPSLLQIIDLETMKLIDALEIPNCTTMCWNMKTAADGSVYFGDYNRCHMYRYNPDKLCNR